jgi:hypothetical protein
MDVNLNRLYVVDYNNHAVRIIHLDAYVGMHNVFSENSILQVFPNPTDGNLYVKISDASRQYTIQVLNLLGEIIYEKNNCVENHEEIDISKEEAGIYFIQVMISNEVLSVKKVILNKDL